MRGNCGDGDVLAATGGQLMRRTLSTDNGGTPLRNRGSLVLGLRAHLKVRAFEQQFMGNNGAGRGLSITFLQQVAARNGKIMITELDVNDIDIVVDADGYLTNISRAERDDRVRTMYRNFLDVGAERQVLVVAAEIAVRGRQQRGPSDPAATAALVVLSQRRTQTRVGRDAGQVRPSDNGAGYRQPGAVPSLKSRRVVHHSSPTPVWATGAGRFLQGRGDDTLRRNGMTGAKRRMSRRAFAKGLGAAAGLAAVGGVPALVRAQPGPKDDKDCTDATRGIPAACGVTGEPLWRHAAARGILYGAKINVDEFVDVPTTERVVEESLASTVGTSFTMAQVRGGPGGGFTFDRGDQYMEFIAQNRLIPTNLSHLEWYNFIPRTFAESVTPQNAAGKLTEHISTVVGRYRGKVHSWNVVNELFNLNDGRPDGLRVLYPLQEITPGGPSVRGTIWLQFLGPEHIDLAFRTARAADPDALLILNQNAIELSNAAQAQRPNQNHEARREATLNLLRALKGCSVPVDVLGFQGHLNSRTMREQFDADKFRAFLRDVASLGLKIMVTELDVNDVDEPGDIAARDRAVADGYAKFLAALLDEPAVISVTTWGLRDDYSWLRRRGGAEGSTMQRPDGSPLRPLPYDENLNRKLAWGAMAKAFDNAPKRSLTTPIPSPRPVPK